MMAAGGVLLTAACGGPDELPEDPQRALDVLRECPVGDPLWRQALGRAKDPDALAELAGQLESISVGCPSRWEPHWTLGETHFRRRQAEDAKTAYAGALERARKLEDATGTACAANRLGTLSRLAGDVAQAESYFDEALTGARQAGRDDLTAFVLNNLAGLLRQRGELPRAILVFDEAVEFLSKLERAAPARQAAYNQGVLSLELGDVTEAGRLLEDVYRRSLEADDAQTASLAALAMGNVGLALDDFDTARKWFERVTHDHPRTVVIRSTGLGRADLGQGLLDAAAGHFETSQRLALEHDLTLSRLMAEAWNAKVAHARGESAGAIEQLTRVARTADETGSMHKVSWIARRHLGQIHLELGDTDAAVVAFRGSVEILESLGSRLDPLGAGLHFMLKRIDPYADLAVALAARERPLSHAAVDEIFRAIESAHARALRSVLGDRANVDRVSVADLQTSLREGEVLLDYLLGRERGVAIAVTRDEVQVSLVEGWQSIMPELQRYRAALQRPLDDFAARASGLADLEADVDAGHRLRESLFGPFSELVEQAERIYIVPDGSLALVPFAAIPLERPSGDPVRFLGEATEVALMPLAGAPPRTNGVSGRILAGGNPRPGTDGELGALPRTRLEIDGVSTIWGQERTDVLDAGRFTKRAFVEAPLPEYGVVHLATHALASTLDPRKCAVVFDEGERLGFDQIAALELGSALVVLSACRSGEGETIPGQGVVGLGQAFLLAGARGLALSLWSIEDGAASDLMIEFHRHLEQGADPVRSLALAQRALRAQQDHPAFWAPFVLYLNPV